MEPLDDLAVPPAYGTDGQMLAVERVSSDGCSIVVIIIFFCYMRRAR